MKRQLVLLLILAVASCFAVWQPVPGTTWQWQILGKIDASFKVDMYDIDLFDTPTNLITNLKNSGKVVICYFSAGSYENWRSDADSFPTSVLGKALDGWPGEKWLDIRKLSVLKPIMQARLDLAVEKGCDGVEPDNVDGYINPTGFPLTAADQLAYNRMLANQAHSRGLSVGLKNDVDQLSQLVDDFDWALNEECFYYDECDQYSVFINKNKAVFHVEYETNAENFCSQTTAIGLSSMQKNWDLQAPSEVCWTKAWNSYCTGLDACICRKFHQTNRCTPLYDHYTSTPQQKATLRVNDDRTRSTGRFTVIGRKAGLPEHDSTKSIKIYLNGSWTALSSAKAKYLRNRLFFKQRTTKVSNLFQQSTTLSNPFICGYKQWFLFPLTVGQSTSNFVVYLTINC